MDLNRLALSDDLVQADQPKNENYLMDHAVEILDRVNAAREQASSEADVNLLASIIEIADLYEARGRTEFAVKVMEKISVVMRTLSSDRPDLLTLQHELAGVFQADGQVNRAVELLEHIVNVEGALLDAENPDRLASMHELARAYQADGQNKRAVPLLEYVVAVEMRILSEEDPARLASQHMLAIFYLAEGQISHALRLLDHVVAVRERWLDSDHPDRRASHHDYAAARRDFWVHAQTQDTVCSDSSNSVA
jgi:tetratricopeptide (TPR) repeat protein